MPAISTYPNPFRLEWGGVPSPLRALVRLAGPLLERLLALPGLNRVYHDALDQPADGLFAARVLEALHVRFEVDDAELAQIPRHGPLIVVANHPFGGVEGLILSVLLRRVRPDVRLMANFLLGRIPELRGEFVLVDPFGGRDAARRNVAAIRAATRWVAEGGALGVFPAGEVSHLTLRDGCVTDPAWSETIGRLALRTRAAVVPVFFEGRNRSLFQIAGLLHPRLRTILLPREFLNKRSRSFQVRVGGAIAAERLAEIAAAERRAPAARRVTDYLRLRTYILRGRAQMRRRPAGTPPLLEPIAAPEAPAAIEAELAALPAGQRLASNATFGVLLAEAGQIPVTLREIGRLRELTFREVGEGTGRSRDLDRFDDDYRHLIVWDESRRCVVGAYRIGLTDEIVARHGVAGLYTRTLFDFDRRLLDQLGPALELGRSFVIAEYQRNFAPLMLLWKGIGQFVARHMRYRMLFGPVSISDEYHSMTKQLLMAFLQSHDYRSELRALIRPIHPPPMRRFRDCGAGALSATVRSIADVDELVGEIESSRRGVPVLLRQYLRLNGRLLGFNIDPAFGDVLDGLIVVDLARVERPVLNRYLGTIEAGEFLRFHDPSTAR